MSGNPSWETMVDQVCVNGRPDWLGAAAGIWDTVFSNASTVAEALRDSAGRLEAVWSGPAGEHYQAHLRDIVRSIDDIRQHNQGVQHLLSQAATDLGAAQAGMPIPDHMLGEVYNHRQQLDAANGTYGTLALAAGTVALAPVAVPMWGAVGGASAFTGGQFFNSLVSKAGNLSRDTLGWLKDKFNDHTAQAQQYYNDVNGRYGKTITEAGQPSSGTPVVSANTPFTNPSSSGPGGGVSGVSGLHGADPHAMGAAKPSGSMSATPGVGTMAGSGPPAGGTMPGNDPPTTSLAGAGGPTGLLGVGSGGPGLGAGGGLGSGGGGGAGLPGGVGRPVNMGLGPDGSPLIGGVSGARIGAGGGSGRGGSAAGMMGGSGAGAGGDRKGEHTSRLWEDDEVWGQSGDMPPAVLGIAPEVDEDE
jgi:hypothetical protein